MNTFETVTELPGNRGHKEQLAAIFTRYHFASEFCKGKDALEVAWGSGIGLGYLAREARSVASLHPRSGSVNGPNTLLTGTAPLQKSWDPLGGVGFQRIRPEKPTKSSST